MKGRLDSSIESKYEGCAYPLVVLNIKMLGNVMRVGIFGGTFDPVHYGHLIAAECVKSDLDLNQILFIPNHAPPHKVRKDLTDARLRVEMLKLATQHEPHFQVSMLEIERSGPSYTIDTLRALKEKEPQWELFFIIGSDMLADLHLWKDIEQVLRLCSFIVVPRAGWNLDKGQVKIGDQIRQIQVVSMPQVDINSSDLRERVRLGKPIKYCMPSSVKSFIKEKGLYR